jgi:hypothetical protein
MGVWVYALIATLIQRLFSLRNRQKKSAPKCVCRRRARGGRQTGGLSAAAACGRRLKLKVQLALPSHTPCSFLCDHHRCARVTLAHVYMRLRCYAPHAFITAANTLASTHALLYVLSSSSLLADAGAGFPLSFSQRTVLQAIVPRDLAPRAFTAACSVRMMCTHPPLFRTLAVPGHPLHT